MAKRKENSQAVKLPTPKSAEFARSGIATGADFANLMSALMSDIIEGRVTPNIGNATCKAAGQLLRVVELQMKYGTAGEGGGKVLRLAMQQPIIGSELKQ
jgi:hypothetical protein